MTGQLVVDQLLLDLTDRRALQKPADERRP
jgi:hypothetical protein